MRSINVYGDPIPGIIIKEERDSFRVEAEKIIERLLKIQNQDGSWGARDEFEKIYHTTQVLQALFHAGFPINDEKVAEALGFLDKYLHLHVDNRAVYFLYTALDRLSENELLTYLIEILKKKQNKDGSFLFFTQKGTPDTATEDHWVRDPQKHRGASVFHTLHTIHMLSMIDTEKYPSTKEPVEEIMNKSLDFLKSIGDEMHRLPDKDGIADPEFTSWWLERLHMLGKLPNDYENTVRWILEMQEDGFWKATVATAGISTKQVTVLPSCYTICKLCSLPLEDHLLNEVKSAINTAMDKLIENKDIWENDENKSAVIARTLISGSNLIQPRTEHHIYNRSMYSNIRIAFNFGKTIQDYRKRLRILYIICSILLSLIICLLARIGQAELSSLLNRLREIGSTIVILIGFVAAIIGIVEYLRKFKNSRGKRK